MQNTEGNQAYFRTAARQRGYFGSQQPRQFLLSGRVTMARQLPVSTSDPDVTGHWLAEFAARAQFDALRSEQLQV